MSIDARIQAVIVKYFTDGLSYEEILEFLKVHHDYTTSLSTLKRWLRKNGIKRRSFRWCSV